MDTNENQDEQKEPKPWEGGGTGRYGRYRVYRVLGGIFLVLVGLGVLFERAGVLNIFPWWLSTWPMILIVFGVFVGIRHGFRTIGPLVPIAIGIIFLLQEIYPATHVAHFIWPVALIMIGLGIIFSRHRNCGPWGRGPWGGPWDPRMRERFREKMRRRWGDDWEAKWQEMKQHRHEWRDWKRSRYEAGTSSAAGEVLDVNAVFGSVKRTVLSKDFAGGEVNAVLGGCEVDFTKADFNGRAILEVNAVFGGARIIVPPNWTVVSEMDSVFGSLEDKRPTHLLHPDPEKVLVLRGGSVFGGTELSL